MILFTVAVIGALMLAESALSARNERALRVAGAREPVEDVYRWMAVVYPACFIAMAAEGLLRAGPHLATIVAGAIVFTAAKGLKYWAIASLGSRWSFRVLVLPGLPLVTSGPYRFLRHPNYVAVVGELVGAALLLQAPVAGTAGTLLFVELLRRRIRVEDRALGRIQAPGLASAERPR